LRMLGNRCFESLERCRRRFAILEGMVEEAVCPLCDGMGMRVVTRADGGRMAEPCDCQHQRRMYALLRRAQIPYRYAGCSLGNFEKSAENAQAFITADGFVNNYPGTNDGTGILLTGTVGLGKTHLAAAILQKLTLEKGVPALFCDYRELLKQITNSYNSRVDTTELEVLKPVFETEVLVLDELGAAKPTDWVWDTVGSEGAGSGGRFGNREETLGDRIGDRMWSRLQEMCVPVEMRGADYRQGAKRARFS
jgi:DNA replication protein DnaC